jgi:hypothetical protein
MISLPVLFRLTWYQFPKRTAFIVAHRRFEREHFICLYCPDKAQQAALDATIEWTYGLAYQ